MRFLYSLLLLPLVIVALCSHTFAQGSSGLPVYKFDFGAGANPGLSIGARTNMAYTAGCPVNGQYTIINSLNALNCNANIWQPLDTDHTSGPGGYMMVINTSALTNVFFTAPLKVQLLCPNTTYRFSAFIANLISPSAGPGFIEPNVTFTVTTAAGVQLAPPHSTGKIAPGDPAFTPWKKYFMDFTTPANITSVIITLTNNAPSGNGNDLALDDVSVAAYGPALTASVSNNSFLTTLNLCAGQNATPTISSTEQPGVYANPAFQWQEDINGAGWVDLQNQKQPTLTINNEFKPAVTGVYRYRIGAAEAANINSRFCRVYSAPDTITVNPIPVVSGVPAGQLECEGGTLILTASGGTSYLWSGPNMQPTVANPLIIPNLVAADVGTYSVIAYDQNNCPSAPAKSKVSFYPKPIITAGGAATICQGASTPLSASGGVSYVWTPGNSLSNPASANPIASPVDTTTYKVIATDANQCVDSAFVTVNVIKIPMVSAGPDKSVFEGQSVKLDGSVQYAASYFWTPATGLSNPNLLQPIATPAADITYTLHASSANNCSSAISNVTVKVYKQLNIPNTFSPNNDGKNDTWNIDALAVYPESVMLIFNRYGQQLFKSIGYTKPWDGTYDGKPVPAGAYYYVLDLKDGNPELSGYVMVVR